MKRDEIDNRVRAWMLRVHPEEKPLIGDFSKTVTWREIARRMLAGECFYDICDCGESVQREHAFGEMARLFGVPYGFFYDCWLHNGRGLDRNLKARVKARIAEAK